MTYDDEVQEHECPAPLARPVEEFDRGGSFFSPAGRWELITDRTPFSEAQYSARVVIHTDRLGDGSVWTFWRSDKMPYLPAWALRPKFVCTSEVGDIIAVEVSERPRDWGHGHPLIQASLVRGEGWRVSDCPDGRTPETVTVDSKAKARTEVKRRAKAHAKRLGIALYQPEATR